MEVPIDKACIIEEGEVNYIKAIMIFADMDHYILKMVSYSLKVIDTFLLQDCFIHNNLAVINYYLQFCMDRKI